MNLDLSGLKPMNEDEKVPCGIDGLMIDMGESKEFVMELWAKSDSFFDGYHAKKKEEIVRCKDCKFNYANQVPSDDECQLCVELPISKDFFCAYGEKMEEVEK